MPTKYYEVRKRNLNGEDRLFKTPDKSFAQYLCNEYNKCIAFPCYNYYVTDYEELESKYDNILYFGFVFTFDDITLYMSFVGSHNSDECGCEKNAYPVKFINVNACGTSYEKCLNKAKYMAERIRNYSLIEHL